MTDNHDPLDANLKRMLESALEPPRAEFQERLVRDVLTEVQQQRRLANTQATERQRELSAKTGAQYGFAAFLHGLLPVIKARLWSKPLAVAGATVVVLIAGASIWFMAGDAKGSIGQVKCLYGFVNVQHKSVFHSVAVATNLTSGQRIQTQAGSQAEILLPDTSRLVPAPRTTLQVAQSRKGPQIRLEKGAIYLEAAKQQPGKAIQIEASGANIKVLGTRLDVRVVEKPSGTRQTRVRVLSGSVEMESGGRSILLLAGTEGLADTGQPPTRSSLVFEVNNLVELFNQARNEAAASGHPYDLPAIFDLTTGTLWTVIPGHRLEPAGANAFFLKLKRPAFGATAFTLDGAEVPTTGNGNILRLDMSRLPTSPAPEHLILKVPGMAGLLRETATGLNECSLAGTETGQPRLLEFHLPGSARLEHVTPGALATHHNGERLIVRVLANVQLPAIW